MSLTVVDQEPHSSATSPRAVRGLDEQQLLRHELRTPINQILGYTRLLQHELRGLAPQTSLDDLEKIRGAAQKLFELIRALDGPAGGSSGPPSMRRVPSVMIHKDALLGEQRREAPAAAQPDDGAGATILVVDDNEMNREILSRALRMNGYAVEVAAGGEEALAMLGDRPFDAVLLDVMMPGMNGLEVLREARKRFSVADLPIIMATARDRSEDIVEALHLGANDYVSKPLDFEVVAARLQIHLSLKRFKEEIETMAGDLERKNRFIQKVFGRYLSDEVVAELLESPEGLRIGGEKRRVSILMSDLRGFTALTEAMPPEKVVHLLNNYLGTMAEIIARYGGTIDEFIGDAILAVFGAPQAADDDALRAAACALEMQLAMDAVNAYNEREALPSLQMGIALHTGEVVVGNIGSEMRAKYGVVGSHVNLTARIESFTVGGQILISESTRGDIGQEAEIGRTMSIDAKGFKERIVVHDLIGLGPPYDLFLPSRDEAPFPLRRPLGIHFSRLSEKLINAEISEARITGLSLDGAAIEHPGPPPAFANLRLRFTGEVGKRAPADLYAKVIESHPEEGRFLVRFTSFSPPMLAFLRELLIAYMA
ncbi:MAG: adenylate/guanylate cyclase domain-containing protein [Byssovorax sp.]